MAHYLIEFRFSGYAKKYLKELIYEVARKFHVRGAVRNRAIPHITLVGPFYTRDERRLIREFNSVARKYDLVQFRLNGFGHFHGSGFLNWLFGKQKVVFAEVKGSNELNKMRLELVENLKSFCRLNEHDYEKDRHFHATIAFKDINKKFDDIWKYLQSRETPNIKQLLLRITLIKNQKILYEYDFMQKRLFNRAQAKNSVIFKRTLQILKNKMNG
jgi:hypothetical protein